MAVTWKAKNKQSLNEMIKKNELEIKSLGNHLRLFFNTEDEKRKIEMKINALERENERLDNITPSELSPSEIMSLTRSLLPELEMHSGKKTGKLIKIPFVDTTAPDKSKNRHAIWKLSGSNWEYDRCE